MKAFIHLKEKSPISGSKNIPIEVFLIPRKGENITPFCGGDSYVVERVEYALFEGATYPVEIYASRDGDRWGTNHFLK